ncbi:MAG: hypothetical protein ACK4EY_07510 [Flavipsychrobacter sp.]
MKYFLGKYWPLALSSLITYIFYKLHYLIHSVGDIIDKLLGTALTVSGTLLGFLLTIVTIISAIDTRRMRFVKQQGGYSTLQNYMRWAIIANLCTIVISFLSPIILSVKSMSEHALYVYLIDVFVVCYTLCVSARFTYVFTTLLHDSEA